MCWTPSMITKGEKKAACVSSQHIGNTGRCGHFFHQKVAKGRHSLLWAAPAPLQSKATKTSPMPSAFGRQRVQNTSRRPAETPLTLLYLRNFFILTSLSVREQRLLQSLVPSGQPRQWGHWSHKGLSVASGTSQALKEAAGLLPLTNPTSGLLQGFGEPARAPSDQNASQGCRGGVLLPLNQSQ